MLKHKFKTYNQKTFSKTGLCHYLTQFGVSKSLDFETGKIKLKENISLRLVSFKIIHRPEGSSLYHLHIIKLDTHLNY